MKILHIHESDGRSICGKILTQLDTPQFFLRKPVGAERREGVYYIWLSSVYKICPECDESVELITRLIPSAQPRGLYG